MALSLDIEPISNASFVPNLPTHLSLDLSTRDIGKNRSSFHSSSPPPILRSSLQDIASPACIGDQSHSSQVEKVSSALDPGLIEEDSSKDEDFSADEHEEMSDDGDPDDDMTLNQYQEEARRDALIRKNSQTSDVLPKKGRVEAGSSRS